MSCNIAIATALLFTTICGFAEESVASTSSPAITQQFLTARTIEMEARADLLVLDPGHGKTILEFQNFPIEEEITLAIQRQTVEGKDVYDDKGKFSIRKDKVIVVAGRPTTQTYCVSSRGFLPGERIFLRFETKSGFQHDISMIPNPMVAESAGKDITLSAELISLTPAVYKLMLKGLEENEEFILYSSSFDEVIQKSVKAAGQGLTEISISPDVVGKKGGVGELMITRQSGAKVKLKLPWGEPLYSYSVGNTVYNPFQ